jgi:branched-chain amino acid transport system substrate-binding protein
MSWRRAVIGLASCALAVGVVGCGSSSSKTSSTSAKSASGTQIRVLWLGDLTGPAKVFGQVQLTGLEGAAAYYNANGGIDGHKVVVTHVSDNSDPSTAVSELLQQLGSSPPTMIWGGSVAGDIAGTIPLIAKRRVFTIAENDGNHQCMTNASVTCPTEWTLGDPSIDPMLTLAAWLKQKGFKKVGLLQETDTLSEAETPDFVQAVSEAGIAHSIATFPATAVDLTPQMSELKSAGVDAVFMEALGAPAGYALEARAKLGWNVPMSFDIAASSLDLTKLVPPADIANAYEDIFYEQDPSDPSPGIPAMFKWTKPYGTVGPAALDTMSVGWDALVALNDAVKEDGNNLSVNALDAAMLRITPTDPLRTFSRRLGFSTSDHENVLGATDDFEIVPAGPVVNGQVHSLVKR